MGTSASWFKNLTQGISQQLLFALSGYIVLAILAVVLTNTWMNTVATLRAQGITKHETISQLQALRTNLARAEAAQSTYLLTQNASYSADFNTHMQEVRSTIAALNNAYKKQIAQDAYDHQIDDLWLQIQQSAEGKLTVMQYAISMYSRGRGDKAMDIIAAGDGSQKMEDFYLHTQQLLDIEEQALQSLRSRNGFFLMLGRVALSVSFVLVLLVLMLVLKKFIVEMVNSRRSKEQLQQDVQDFERQLAERTRMLETLARDYQFDVERQRLKLSRELHDELGSILTATKMDISWAIKRIRDSAPETAEKLAKTMRHLDQGIEFKRRVVNDLHPSLLTTFGLVPALKELVDGYAERNSWQLNVVLPDANLAITEVLGLIAYRIVQETLSNAAKYAKATEVSIHFVAHEFYLQLDIRDNGKGMDTSKHGLATHGLDGMRHRVIAVGGSFTIISEPGKGMLTQALIPLGGEFDGRISDSKRMA